MRVVVFSAKSYDREFLTAANERHGHELLFLEGRLTAAAASLGTGFPAICAFVNDELDAGVLRVLAGGGTRLVALRSAGFNNLDLAAASELGITVSRVPAYSPYAVAEHTIGLILALDRRLHRVYARVREGNLALEGLLGFDLNGKTVGVVGTGRIGSLVAGILMSFGCNVLAYDPAPNPKCVEQGVRYVGLDELFRESAVMTLHVPLTPETQHLIDARAIGLMKQGVMLINTSRGGLVDTRAVVGALKTGHIAYLGLDVYEEEGDLFFRDLSNQVIQDDVFSRLLTFPNVLITGHQGFFTREAMEAIAEVTLDNVTAFEQGRRSGRELTPELMRG